jgi:hypothetical protein
MLKKFLKYLDIQYILYIEHSTDQKAILYFAGICSFALYAVKRVNNNTMIERTKEIIKSKENDTTA